MTKVRESYVEPIKRFNIAPTEYETTPCIVHCNAVKLWQSYLRIYFSNRLNIQHINYELTISNAAYRISGLELKIGLLLSDDEFGFSKGKLLSNSFRPSIVIDSILAIFGVLEGLAMLSYFCSLDEDRRKQEIHREKRGHKIGKGLRFALNKNVDKELAALKVLRDRCMHQDYADRQDGKDYEHMFDANSVRPHVGILYRYLKALEADTNKMPNTNLDEFWHFDRLKGF